MQQTDNSRTSQSPVVQPNRLHQRTSFRWGSLIGLGVGLVLFGVSLMIAEQGQLTGWQLDIFRAVNDMTNSLKTPTNIITEALGSVYPIIIILAVPLIMKKWRLAWRFLATIGGSLVISELAKKVVDEARPAILLHGDLHLRASESGAGFPSNHTTAATAMALTLWFLLPKKWRFLSAIWIIVVAVSRLYLGVHSPVDVVGGFAIGLIVVCVIRLLPIKLAKPLRLDY